MSSSAVSAEGAQQPPGEPQAARPERLGSFDAWTAVAYGKAGQRVCYAFARSTAAGANHRRATLTVAHWPRDRNQVSLSAGFAFPQSATLEVAVGRTKLTFVAHEDTAQARDGLSAVLAFRRGAEAVARRPSRRGGTATDTFSLAGFGPAYDAISRACISQPHAGALFPPAPRASLTTAQDAESRAPALPVE